MFILVIATIMLLSISTIYASENNSVSDNDNTINPDTTISKGLTSNDNIVSYDNKKSDVVISITNTTDNKNTGKNSKKDTAEDVDELFIPENDCCTTIIQVSSDESILSFRRDSTGSTTNIYMVSNETHVKQYKTTEGYFFHVLISKDGWLCGTGGADSASINKQIEARALTMMKNDKITTADLNYIASLHKSNLGIGHFVIKAPDGRYGLEISRSGSMVLTGTLKNGEYLVCPNSRSYYHKGNYTSYTGTSNVITASRLLALKDRYGVSRRDITTFHYKRNLTAYKIDLYACNDDGSYVGRSTSGLRDNIVTSTKTIYAGNLPTGNRGLFVQSYVFKRPIPKISFTVSSQKDVYVMGDTATFKVNLLMDNVGVNTGYVIFKINSVTIKDNNSNPIKCYVKNGVASIKYTIPDGWSARQFNISSVYSISDFGRIENRSYFNLRRSNITMKLKPVVSNNRTVRIEGKFYDEHNHNVRGLNTVAVKIDGLTLKFPSGVVRIFNVTNGNLLIIFTLPNIYKPGHHTITLTTGTRAGYNSKRDNTTLDYII